jgi:hypothetical protein
VERLRGPGSGSWEDLRRPHAHILRFHDPRLRPTPPPPGLQLCFSDIRWREHKGLNLSLEWLAGVVFDEKFDTPVASSWVAIGRFKRLQMGFHCNLTPVYGTQVEGKDG